jgi:group II intron reverse transcriptase/maturase
MGAVPAPLGKAMYVASRLDQSWLQNEQRKLYARSMENPAYVFHKLWGLITDPRNLRNALARVARNKGRRTAGVDGITVGRVLELGAEEFVAHARAELRSGAYRPSPVRRVLIPKTGQPGKFRPLGIPTVRDRVIQAAMKNILEPIFEADFFPTSCGFRPGKSVHGTLEQLRKLLRPRAVGSKAERQLPYQWAIEGDIKGCFDNIDHHGLMKRVRLRINDLKVNRLVLAFLRAGVLSEGQFWRTASGTPQGGILSPLLANVALSAIEERYERYAWPRRTPTLLTDGKAIIDRAANARCNDKRLGRVVCMPVRYADDFIVLVGAPPGSGQHDRARVAALHEKAELATLLKNDLGLELSEAKTFVTPVTERMRFLGHQLFVRPHPTHGRMVSTTVVPKDRSHLLRETIKDLFGYRTFGSSLAGRLKLLNPLLRGWANFYRHAWGAKRVFGAIDHYVWWTILRWLRKKHRAASLTALRARYARRTPGRLSWFWEDGGIRPFALSRVRVEQFRLAWLKTPDFANIYGEPGA